MGYCCVCGLDLNGSGDPALGLGDVQFINGDDEMIHDGEADDFSPELLDWTQTGHCALGKESFELGSNRSDVFDCVFTTLQGEEVAIKRHLSFNSEDDEYLPEDYDFQWFPVHFRCLTLVEYVLGSRLRLEPNRPISSLAVIQRFYQILYLLRKDLRKARPPHGLCYKGVLWSHGYYGALGSWYYHYNYWDFLSADPFNIPNLTEYVLSSLKTFVIKESEPQLEVVTLPPRSDQGIKRSTLQMFPMELLNRITSNLPCSSILRLHRTSRIMSNRLPVTQSFWRDQLLSGNLVPFLWDLDATKCRELQRSLRRGLGLDWRTLVRNLIEHQFIECAVQRLLKVPLRGHLVARYTAFWEQFSANPKRTMTGPAKTPPGLINRIRMMKIINDAIELGDSTAASKVS
ncbi:uncharacterized protein BP5553_00753 [Venustampulla echinocandica]|uniref:F-box domain-containing protein n=1 Tax=Venustampulla echinocandica TaxID=2656787 RepID=A0A370TZ42_9HELO|nr:uncharacterized protein BP5553_00753 [Venustampulla echinocandica]RDL40774.1 hypothetical protein BP5553_00753 [Venustampulla echinocandica]